MSSGDAVKEWGNLSTRPQQPYVSAYCFGSQTYAETVEGLRFQLKVMHFNGSLVH